MKANIYQHPIVWMLITALIIIVVGALSFRPIVNPTEKDCSKITGILQKYRYSEDVEDIVIKLDGYNKIFYLNRVADEKNAILCELDSLINKKIILYAVNHWTLLDPKSTMKHVARVTNGDGSKIIFTEY
jgi:hypothetical protein